MPPLRTASFAAIFVGNCILGALAIAMQWDVHTVARVVWLDAGIVGLFAAIKIVLAKEVGAVGRTKPYKVVLFGAHFGTSCAFYTQLISHLGRGHLVPLPPLLIAIPILLVVHGITLKTQSWDRGELRSVSAFMFMLLPYARLLPPAVAVLLVVLADLGQLPLGNAALVALVAKTVGDVVGHWLEHGVAVPRVSQPLSPDTSS